MAIHLAAKHGHKEVLQNLVETGVDIDERNIVSKEHIVTVSGVVWGKKQPGN